MLKDTHVLNYVTENNLNLSLQQIQKKFESGIISILMTIAK